MPKLTISPKGLFLPLKTTFKQASSVRHTAESVWVVAGRGRSSGYGEGCPRSYVTGEETGPCLKWLEKQLPEIEQECTSLEKLRNWVEEKRLEIDKHPAAWCSVELALLDLFAREQGRSVEAMLGLKEPDQQPYIYTAVLSDGNEQKYSAMVERYLAGGFRDFKVKISGEATIDSKKLKLLKEKCVEARIESPRIRLDANNLWAGNIEAAISYLTALGRDFFAIEEPLAPRLPKAMSQISKVLQAAVILDESLLTLSDLAAYEKLPGRFIANIKVSRVGGVLRALELIKILRKREWPIIIGAHVGETSVLTRAGMLAAQAAGDRLIAQEGGYGTMLLETEPIKPSLQFGYGGKLDFARTDGIESGMGWGLHPGPSPNQR